MGERMMDLSNISGIDNESLELLEVAGFADVESLAKAGIKDLVVELERANSILKIAKNAPTEDNVASWIAAAREFTGVGANDWVDVDAS